MLNFLIIRYLLYILHHLVFKIPCTFSSLLELVLKVSVQKGFYDLTK